MQMKKLFAFDVLIVVGATRFTEFDIQLAKEAAANGVSSLSLSSFSHLTFLSYPGLHQVPVVFVRNKADVDIKNKAEREGKTTAQVKQAVGLPSRMGTGEGVVTEWGDASALRRDQGPHAGRAARAAPRPRRLRRQQQGPLGFTSSLISEQPQPPQKE